ncbi:MAG TPA: hypothetical protein DEG17_13975 [Cyanobacteria bacterium UBA11149]|nr:hypothetical protein [Cyanobacteria bacterium UBA11367]HBE58782.1 hypothetical protein [Cyanobacteria bacterium UBA11366]HBK64590.1 hypothetical protein [Cyanobacteria bacterium UBA11166]HBR76729.1 hypothetical protein [Cyanobacteria bacterium UBA11159]HBS69230.1 hypothetical protein [Cyanobacteria bacterium UBA11153]HBW89946.1 hypothetical protein [Cyanobacteria bacterium UBA11149]HCA94905.1 hypothetical protein [Cyanobacteria bacterium UBA9226]
MNAVTFFPNKSNNRDRYSKKTQLKSLVSRTDEKFNTWIVTVEDRWLEEIAACLEGNFPDWRS